MDDTQVVRYASACIHSRKITRREFSAYTLRGTSLGIWNPFIRRLSTLAMHMVL